MVLPIANFRWKVKKAKASIFSPRCEISLGLEVRSRCAASPNNRFGNLVTVLVEVVVDYVSFLLAVLASSLRYYGRDLVAPNLKAWCLRIV